MIDPDLLCLNRSERKRCVQQLLEEAFAVWEFPKPTKAEFVACGQKPLYAAESWRDIPEAWLERIYPQDLEKSVWLWALPALLLCCEREESIGKNPISLGLPPLPDRLDREVVPFHELVELLTFQQRKAIRSYAELYSWLRYSAAEYSHWEEGWRSISD